MKVDSRTDGFKWTAAPRIFVAPRRAGIMMTLVCQLSAVEGGCIAHERELAKNVQKHCEIHFYR